MKNICEQVSSSYRENGIRTICNPNRSLEAKVSRLMVLTPSPPSFSSADSLRHPSLHSLVPSPSLSLCRPELVQAHSSPQI